MEGVTVQLRLRLLLRRHTIQPGDLMYFLKLKMKVQKITKKHVFLCDPEYEGDQVGVMKEIDDLYVKGVANGKFYPITESYLKNHKTWKLYQLQDLHSSEVQTLEPGSCLCCFWAK